MWISINRELAQRAIVAFRKVHRNQDAQIFEEEINSAAADPKTIEKYRIAANEFNRDDGELEFDDDAVVSSSDEGAYVMAWKWVDKDEAGIDVRVDASRVN